MHMYILQNANMYVSKIKDIKPKYFELSINIFLASELVKSYDSQLKSGDIRMTITNKS